MPAERPVRSLEAIYCDAVDRFWHREEFAVLDELFSPDYQGYDDAHPRGDGREGMQRALRELHRCFSEPRYDVLECIASGDWLATRWTLTAKLKAPFAGATRLGKQFSVPGFSFNRFRGGQIVEGRMIWDPAEVRRQLGE